MVNAESVRKVIHLFYPIALYYYWLPPDTYIGVDRNYIVVAVAAIILVIEAIRLLTKVKIPFMRNYEEGRIAGYVFGSIGIALGLIFFPLPVTAAAVCGMAWIDPVCSATKKSGGYPVVPVLAYLDLTVLIFLASNYQPANALLYGIVGGVVAIAAERPNIKHIDDDFIMTVVPLLVLGALTYYFGGLLP